MYTVWKNFSFNQPPLVFNAKLGSYVTVQLIVPVVASYLAEILVINCLKFLDAVDAAETFPLLVTFKSAPLRV